MSDDMQQEVRTIRDDVNTLRVDVNTLRGDVNALRDDMGVMRGDVNTLRGDVNILREDVNALRDDMGVMRGDVNALRRDVSSIDRNVASIQRSVDDIRGMFKRTMVLVAQNTGDIADIKSYLRTEVVTKDEFHFRMDGFSKKLDDAKFDWAQLKARDEELDKRVVRLENPDS